MSAPAPGLGQPPPVFTPHPLEVTYTDVDGRQRVLFGTAWDFGTSVVVEARGYPENMSGETARLILRDCVSDGRCKLPDEVRARLDRGESQLR